MQTAAILAIPAMPAEQIDFSEVPKSIFFPVSEFKDSGLGDSVASPAARAPSVASHSSYLSSKGGEEKTRFRAPNLPIGESFGEPFSCHFCGERVLIRDRVEWK
jgi:hypothetical protein